LFVVVVAFFLYGTSLQYFDGSRQPAEKPIGGYLAGYRGFGYEGFFAFSFFLCWWGGSLRARFALAAFCFEKNGAAIAGAQCPQTVYKSSCGLANGGAA